MMPATEVNLLDMLNTPIRVDAKIYGITNVQLMELTESYVQEYGMKPSTLLDLLEVIF